MIEELFSNYVKPFNEYIYQPIKSFFDDVIEKTEELCISVQENINYTLGESDVTRSNEHEIL
ncbi:hypothetical protein [Wolbachia endosymbiont of Ctenocephalides felis wCfeT]|uniref:hypothetical protein n=1 Tax=Wolbachia endosymbiont of Ctenocephalides felis wCfeT TaxID=2732593 RepID=UPI0014482AB5|nr:hypothetical protein [Wolbachia endosymbiont of Ctenocephalides felis wCfeT]